MTEIICRGDNDTCGRRFTSRGAGDLLLTYARVAGWKIGQRPDGSQDAMCPRCAAPDPEMVRLCRDLARSVKR